MYIYIHTHTHNPFSSYQDALDAAGNTTAAIGKGFAIGSACLVGLALFGAFVTRLDGLGGGDIRVDLLDPLTFSVRRVISNIQLFNHTIQGYSAPA